MSPRILVVEDEALAALALEDLLSSEGFDVTLAANGDEALAAFSAQPPDAVITDLNMPGMSGVELMRRVRLMDQALPILVMTGYRALTPDVEGIRDALPELTPVLEKPVDLTHVSSELRRLLSAAQQRRAFPPADAGATPSLVA